MQQYFKTGKTIVIDDQYNEAKPLLDALSRNQIPFLYSQGKPNSDFPLPNSDPKNAQYYSLVFLDLNLDFKFAGGKIGGDGDEKTFKGTHSLILDTIVKNKNRSFILVIWSNEEENYKDEFLKIFDKEEKYGTSKKPYKIISLSKPNFFTPDDEGNYQFISGKEEELKNKINSQLEGLEAFKLFCEWDRVVAHSVGDTIDDFMGLVNSVDKESEREEYLAKVITAISVAYSGVEGYLNLKTNIEKTDSVFLALTQLLNDDIDRNVIFTRQREFTEWKAHNKKTIDRINSEIDSNLLNRKLLIYQPNRPDLTGSVYWLKIEREIFRNICTDSFDYSSFSKDFVKLYKHYNGNLDEDNLEKLQRKYCLRILEKDLIAIEVNISPLCDIVQNKIIYHRLVKGFLIPHSYSKITNKKNDYFTKSPVFEFNGNNYYLGLDFRTFTSCSKEEINKKEYAFTLRANLINDIQTKLAAHVSRLGVFNL